ncbi:MAG: hypothetical protein QXW70_02600 [Candidatus Anstonellales archaeon]
MGIRKFIESLRKELEEAEPPSGEEDIARAIGEEGENKDKKDSTAGLEDAVTAKASSKIKNEVPKEGTYTQSSEISEAVEDTKLISSEEKYATEVEKQEEFEGEKLPSGEKVSWVRLGIEIDKLKAQVTALREMRSISEERFYKISEEIGQLKNTIFEIDKNTVELKKRAEIAASLVEAVQPQHLLKEIKRLEVEIEKLSGAHEKISAFQDKINEELKDVRARIAVFRGADAIRELNEEMQKELAELKKTEASIEQHADKVEYIYVMFQKKFSNFEPMFQRVSEITSAVNKLRIDGEKLKLDFKSLATKAEVTELENSLKIRSEAIDKFLRESEKMRQEFELLKENLARSIEEEIAYLKKYVEDTKNEIAETNRSFYEESEAILSKLKDYHKTAEEESARLVERFRESSEEIRGEIGERIAKNEQEIQQLKEQLKETQTNFEKVIRRLIEEINSEISEFGREVKRISGIDERLEREETIRRRIVEELSAGNFAKQQDIAELREGIWRISEQLRKITGEVDLSKQSTQIEEKEVKKPKSTAAGEAQTSPVLIKEVEDVTIDKVKEKKGDMEAISAGKIEPDKVFGGERIGSESDIGKRLEEGKIERGEEKMDERHFDLKEEVGVGVKKGEFRQVKEEEIIKEEEIERTSPKEKPPLVEEDIETETKKRYMPIKEYHPPPRFDKTVPKQYPKIESISKIESKIEKKIVDSASVEKKEEEEVFVAPKTTHPESYTIRDTWGKTFIKKLFGIFGKEKNEMPRFS